MKKKARVVACYLIVCMLFALTGCRLAREDAGVNTYEDRLVGVLITAEYLDLFDFEGYLDDNIGSISGGEIIIDGRAVEYQGRLYATLLNKMLTNEKTGETIEIEKYVFAVVDGMSFYAAKVPATAARGNFVASGSDEAISERHVSLNSGDKANITTLEGTVYISPTGHDRTYYFNPIYQSADGRVYATTGSGLVAGGTDSEGVVSAQTLDARYTMTENGKTVTDSVSVKISFIVMYRPEKIVVLQMDAESAVVSRMEYATGEVPKTITPEKNMAYIVVETHKTDSAGNAQTSRKLYGKDAESLEAFFCREDGVCIQQWIQIKQSR